MSPLTIPVGDKANTWNVYVHEVAPRSELHFLIDGDVKVESGPGRTVFTASLHR